jgi:acyl-CoA thioesterase YciA
MQEPRGELVLRTLAMPADTNPSGDIFGGWIMSQMDLAGGLAAKSRAKRRVVTVAVESMTFMKPVKVGDGVCCYADLEKTGRTSMTLQIEVWVIHMPFDSPREKVTEARITYVAVDEDGRPVRVDPI